MANRSITTIEQEIKKAKEALKAFERNAPKGNVPQALKDKHKADAKAQADLLDEIGETEKEMLDLAMRIGALTESQR